MTLTHLRTGGTLTRSELRATHNQVFRLLHEANRCDTCDCQGCVNKADVYRTLAGRHSDIFADIEDTLD